jgi:hypothetical protein
VIKPLVVNTWQEPTTLTRGSLLMANDYYFFTDINQQASNASDYIKVQTSGSYGPIVPSTPLTNEYRVTSLHSASYNPTAYAACDGIVCVQRIPATIPSASPPQVNVILKPLVQPALNFAPIKYVIYKGILESSLISGTDVAAEANNQLTEFVWHEQAKKNKSAGTTASAPAEALGVGLTAASPPIPNDTINDPFHAEQPIDNLFYRSGVSFQLPTVKGGWSIGQFDKTAFGIEVLMEGLNFNHPLSLARQLEYKISRAALTGSESDAEKFDHWHAKEQVLGFMDPCAFYGSFFRAGIQAKLSGKVPFVKKSGNGLYQDVLFPFANKNTAYLDIRNEHNFYFNYFGNYNDIIRVGNPLSSVDYYESGWPILKLTSSNLQANNTTNARNVFQLRLEEGDNPKPLIYVSQGYRELRTKGDKFPEELTSAERFFDAFLPFGTGHTTPKNASGPNSLTFVVPNVTGLGATTPVSCYIRLKYLKQEQGTTSEPRVIQSANYLDNLIWPVDLNIRFAGTPRIKSFVFEEEVYVNAQDEAGLLFDCIANVGIAQDDDNTSFFLVPTNIRTRAEAASTLVTLTGETSDSPDHYPNFVAFKYPLEKVVKSTLTLPAVVPVARFVSEGNFLEKEWFDVPDFDKFFLIMVANNTYAKWKTRIAAPGGFDGHFRTYLGIKNIKTQTDTVGVEYTSFELVLRGYAFDASGKNYEVREIGTDPVNNTNNLTVYANAGD